MCKGLRAIPERLVCESLESLSYRNGEFEEAFGVPDRLFEMKGLRHFAEAALLQQDPVQGQARAKSSADRPGAIRGWWNLRV